MVVVSPGHAVQPSRRSPLRNSTPPRVDEEPRNDTEDPRDVQAPYDDAELENFSSDVDNSSSEAEGPSLEAVGPRSKFLVFSNFSAQSIDTDVPTLPSMCREPPAPTARSSSWRGRQSTVVVPDVIAESTTLADTLAAAETSSSVVVAYTTVTAGPSNAAIALCRGLRVVLLMVPQLAEDPSSGAESLVAQLALAWSFSSIAGTVSVGHCKASGPGVRSSC